MASEDVDPMIVTAIDIHESTSICIADLQSPPVAPSFTIFNKLPVEIREMIWELACSEPRVFDILPSPFSNAFWCGAPQQGVSVGESGFEEPVSMCSYSRPPALLSVSPEARKVALKYYEPAFEADSSPCGQFKIDGPVKIWIDWKKDLIVPLPVHKEKFDWNFLAKYGSKACRIVLPDIITDQTSSASNTASLGMGSLISGPNGVHSRIYRRSPYTAFQMSSGTTANLAGDVVSISVSQILAERITTVELVEELQLCG